MQLRNMTMADADKMLEWKNYPETRRFAIVSHDEIKREDHLKWLEKNIKDFQIIELADKVVGAIRINGTEISIWIDRNYWGKGMATIVLKRISEPGMWAKIVNGNIASFRAFVKSGFLPHRYSPIDKCYLLEKP